MNIEEVNQLAAELPAIFLGTTVNERTGDVVRWSTLQNRHSRGEVPDGMFAYHGRKKLIRRAPFIDWLKANLSEDAPTLTPPKGRRKLRIEPPLAS